MDLFATNRPSFIQQVGVKSGISDHEIICVESALEAVILESNPRKVYLWNRADFELINNKAQGYCNYFTSHYTVNTPIQDLWYSFKSFCKECLDLIPYKFHKTNNKQPWIKRHIKQLANKKRRLYNEARQSSLQSDWDAYRDIKKHMQKECRHTRDTYVSNLLNPTRSPNNKKFWSYIKSMRNEQCGIPSLERNNQLYTDSTAKANILNDHFSSVFIIDNSQAHKIPTVEGSPYPNM